MTDAEAQRSAPARPVHPVLVGYDGSTASGRALAWAAGMARRTRRPLLVAYITPPPSPYDPGITVAPSTDPQADALRWLRSELHDTLGDTAVADLEAHVTGCQGDAAYELARLADEHQADALVLGAPEHRWHRLIGSVPAHIARHAHCPVIVVP
ncbi:universal stress protein [Streptomyces sp. NPDC050121]|uniref:universal stress protein n=1 Tax=Streptomyces sp. NPDC050121 TaxID=3365601 RepID=UPI00378D3D2C